MGTLYRDMSRISPAPTLKRETASLLANSIVVVAFFAALILLIDMPPAQALIGVALLVLLGARWLYVARRGDRVGD